MTFAPVGPGLYDGRCGIALFLAALDHVRGTQDYRNFIADVLDPLVHLVQTATPRDRWRYLRDQSLGAAGVAGMLYTLVYLHRWQISLKTTSPLAFATLLGETLDEGLVARDQVFDFIGGSAGAIPALLLLFRETQNPDWLSLAERYGQHLLSHQDAETGGWPAPSSPPLTGFSHGATGMAYALLALYAVNGDTAFLAGAMAGLGYETRVFDPKQNNWPDYRFGVDPSVFQNQWCTGAAGIGLGRLACLGLAPQLDDMLMTDLQRALSDLMIAPVNAIDHLC
ncbi:MAG: lanthionine synthetase LanC family protein, partial [Cyanobacteria bacterium J06638_6]